MAVFFITSCNKKDNENNISNNKAQTTRALSGNDSSIAIEIEQFYKQIKDIHKGAKSNESFSVADANKLIEATYNYYCVVLSNEPEAKYNFNISTPISSNSTISASNISRLFYELKDSLMSKIKTSNTPINQLSHFDLSYTINGNYAVFNASTWFTVFQLPPSYNCADSIDSAYNKGFIIANNWNYGQPLSDYTNAQCKINMFTKSAYDTISGIDYPGAASLIRAITLNRTRGCEPSRCFFYTDITDTLIMNGNVISTPISKYKAMNIQGYDNSDIFITTKFFTNTTNETYPNANDPARDLKNYLITPMMNFYIYRATGILVNAIPTGSTIYDFNIIWNYCLCDIHAPDGTWNKPYKTESYSYSITHAIAHDHCHPGIAINNL